MFSLRYAIVNAPRFTLSNCEWVIFKKLRSVLPVAPRGHLINGFQMFFMPPAPSFTPLISKYVPMIFRPVKIL